MCVCGVWRGVFSSDKREPADKHLANKEGMPERQDPRKDAALQNHKKFVQNFRALRDLQKQVS